MWREREVDAIYIGLELNYYWTLTPKTFNKYIEAFNKKEKDNKIIRLKERLEKHGHKDNS